MNLKKKLWEKAITIAIGKCDNSRKRNEGKKQKKYSKNEAMKIKSDNFKMSNMEKHRFSKTIGLDE